MLNIFTVVQKFAELLFYYNTINVKKTNNTIFSWTFFTYVTGI